MSDLVRGVVKAGAGAVAAPRNGLPANHARQEPRPSEVRGTPSGTAEAARPPSGRGAHGDASSILADLGRLIATTRETPGDAAFPWADLRRILHRAVVSLDGSGELFWLASDPATSIACEYLAGHQARVAVLALRVGAALGHDRARLMDLGMAGCLIDVGLWEAPAPSSAEGEARSRAHPGRSAALVRAWSPPGDRIVETILHHHEREGGQGFPEGLQGAALDVDAKVVGLADHYATVTSPPAGQPRLRPDDAVRQIVRGSARLFAPAVVRAFLAEVTIFPPGTLVQLNTGEIGRVIAVHPEHPLRPRVEVAAGSDGRPRIIDLSDSWFLHVTGTTAREA